LHNFYISPWHFLQIRIFLAAANLLPTRVGLPQCGQTKTALETSMGIGL
jgi:hypothetical protein